MKKLLSALLLLSIAACVPDSGALNLTPTTQTQIKKGFTTRDEIVRLLGEPQNQSQDQNTIVYGYIHTINDGTKTTRYALTVYMDKSGIVRNFVFNQGNN